MPGFRPAIHVFFSANPSVKTWMAGTSQAMTFFSCLISLVGHLRREQLLTFSDTNAISTPPGTSGLLAFGMESQMTGSTRSSDGLDERRRRLLFRCWHRGTREMDLILGRFA